MKRTLALSIAILLCTVGVSLGAITASGGTEDFSTVAVSDGTTLTTANIGLTSWTVFNGTLLSYPPEGFHFDTSAGTGTLDSAGFGGSVPPEAAHGIYMVKTTIGSWNAQRQNRILHNLVPVTARHARYEWYVAMTDHPVHANDNGGIQYLVEFPDVGSANRLDIGYRGGVLGTKDIQCRVHANMSAVTGETRHDIGLGPNDDDDYTTNTWYKWAVEFETAHWSTGTVTWYIDDVQVAQDDIIADSNDNQLRHYFRLQSNPPGGTGDKAFLDDLTVTILPFTREENWLLY